jgi:hypothetical protein
MSRTRERESEGCSKETSEGSGGLMMSEGNVLRRNSDAATDVEDILGSCICIYVRACARTHTHTHTTHTYTHKHEHTHEHTHTHRRTHTHTQTHIHVHTASEEAVFGPILFDIVCDSTSNSVLRLRGKQAARFHLRNWKGDISRVSVNICRVWKKEDVALSRPK